MNSPDRPLSSSRTQDAQRHEAMQRREALNAAGCTTYLLQQMSGQPSILCLCCGLRSWHPVDLHELYCGACHAWHGASEKAPAADDSPQEDTPA
jgi:hypothetical protein